MKLINMKEIWYHGTTAEKAKKILESGYFKPGTWFAKEEKHAYKFGGNHIFKCKIEWEPPLCGNWQVCSANKIFTKCISEYKKRK